MTVIKITVIHSKGYNQITMGIETLRNIVIITTDIFAVHTDTPYRQDPNLGEDKGRLLGPKKDKYKVCSLLAKAHKKFWVFSWLDSQFCQAFRYQNRSRGLV